MNILISGTSRGLGKSLAEAYLKQGETVFGCARSASTISDANYHHRQFDLSDETAVNAYVKGVVTEHSKIDVLINNAGLSQSSLAIMTPASTAKSILDVNLLGCFLLTKAAVKQMARKNFGRVIFFSSVNVPLRSHGSALYNASKAGGEALMQSFASENSGFNITFNTLGLSILEGEGMASELSEEAIAKKKKGLRKSKLIGLDEVIHAVDFFSSSNTKNISGQTLYFGDP